MKVLYYGESPLNPTGFGQVNKHILSAINEVADELVLVASTHFHESHDMPYTIIPCESWEDQRNSKNIEKYLKEEPWDVFMYQGDMGANDQVLQWAAEIQKEHPQRDTVFYMPIDGDISLGHAFHPFSWCSAPVVYTNHAKSVIAKHAPHIAEKTSVIWLGCETDVFYPLPEDERRKARIEFFGEQYLNRFMVMNVNRNQVRKDLARCMAAFHVFHEKYPDSTLYMHSVPNDAGGSLPVQAILVGCDVQAQPAEVAFANLNLSNAWPRETLNRLYNAVDLLVSTSYGEGWGLTTSEAMCAGTPVMAPANTANLDILGERLPDRPYFERERGYGVKTGGDLDHTTFIYANGGGPVPHVHLESFVATMEYIYHHREEAQQKAKEALAWCQANTWQHREKNWQDLMTLIKQSHSTRITT